MLFLIITGVVIALVIIITITKAKKYERIGSTKAPNIDSPIDIYNILNNEKVIATLYINPYTKKNSERSPKGFKLIKVSK